jgi:hypothetical protein
MVPLSRLIKLAITKDRISLSSPFYYNKLEEEKVLVKLIQGRKYMLNNYFIIILLLNLLRLVKLAYILRLN